MAQRADVLVVVAHHVDERSDGPAPQEPEIARRDLPAIDIPMALHPEQARLGGAQASVVEAVAEQPAHDRQEIEVAAVLGRRTAVHPVARDEQRPVEAASVVRHEPGIGRDRGRHGLEQGRLLGMVGEEQLDLPEPVAGPPAEPDEEGHGPGRGGEPRRLGVEADERRVGRRLARQCRETVPIDRERPGPAVVADDGPEARADDLGVECGGQPRGQVRRPDAPARRVLVDPPRFAVGRAGRGSIPLESSGEAAARVAGCDRHPAAASSGAGP